MARRPFGASFSKVLALMLDLSSSIHFFNRFFNRVPVAKHIDLGETPCRGYYWAAFYLTFTLRATWHSGRVGGGRCRVAVNWCAICSILPGACRSFPWNVRLTSPNWPSCASAPCRISWPVLFLKAYALVALEGPEFRQVYLSWPWPHLYEHPHNVAMLAVNRADAEGDRLYWGRFSQPKKLTLTELQAKLERYKTGPTDSVFRTQRRLSRVPMPVRRLGWWLTLNLTGASAPGVWAHSECPRSPATAPSTVFTPLA